MVYFLLYGLLKKKGERSKYILFKNSKKNSKQFRLFLHKNEHIYYNYYITQFVLNIRHISLELVTNSKAVLKVH